MEGLLVFGLITAGFALFGGLAVTFGVDSRPEFVDPRLPARPSI